MQDQIFEFLMEYPLAWIFVALLAPLAIGYRYRKFMRAASHANDGRSIALLTIGFLATGLLIWAYLRYT